MSVFDQANSLINKNIIESYFGTEKAYWEKGEFWTLNPLRSDNNIDSFSIREDGMYNDFASKDNGDFINLVSEKFGLNLKESAEKIILDSGNNIEPDKTYFLPKANIKKKTEKPKSKKIGKLSSDEKVELFNFAESNFLIKDKKDNIDYKLNKIFPYKNIDNETLFYIVRYEKTLEDGKQKKKTIPIYKSIDEKWIAKRPDDLLPFPLYNFQRLKDSDKPVLVVSGEKCADIKVDGYNVVTWQGGDGRVSETDWSYLENKDVVLWHDNDKQKFKDNMSVKNKPHIRKNKKSFTKKNSTHPISLSI